MNYFKTKITGNDVEFIRNVYIKEFETGILTWEENKIFGGGETDTSALFPTDAATPAMINIANQGVVTGANNNQTTPAASNAGAQVTSNRGGGVA